MKFNFEIYINGENDRTERLTIEQIQKISDFIDDLIYNKNGSYKKDVK